MKKINQFHESLEVILAHSHPLESEQVSFQEALGRILAEDVIASRNDPPAAKSAMDGYCLRAKRYSISATRMSHRVAIFRGVGGRSSFLGKTDPGKRFENHDRIASAGRG